MNKQRLSEFRPKDQETGVLVSASSVERPAQAKPDPNKVRRLLGDQSKGVELKSTSDAVAGHWLRRA